jgi:hypothetical protein
LGAALQFPSVDNEPRLEVGLTFFGSIKGRANILWARLDCARFIRCVVLKIAVSHLNEDRHLSLDLSLAGSFMTF